MSFNFVHVRDLSYCNMRSIQLKKIFLSLLSCLINFILFLLNACLQILRALRRSISSFFPLISVVINHFIVIHFFVTRIFSLLFGFFFGFFLIFSRYGCTVVRLRIYFCFLLVVVINIKQCLIFARCHQFTHASCSRRYFFFFYSTSVLLQFNNFYGRNEKIKGKKNVKWRVCIFA